MFDLSCFTHPDERAVLAIASASRHPGLAIAIAHTNFFNHELAVAAVPMYLIVGAVVSLPYSKWSARQAHHLGVPT